MRSSSHRIKYTAARISSPTMGHENYAKLGEGTPTGGGGVWGPEKQQKQKQKTRTETETQLN